jgi:hypothetical protein
MSELNYTHGNWYIWHTNNIGDIVQTTNRQITQIVQGNPWSEPDKQESEANARLITAAPDMYQTIRDFIAATEASNPDFSLRMNIAYGKMKKALAKAEGK